METQHLNFAAYFQALRKEARISLRAFCDAAGADPGNISRLERRTIPPPQDREILSRYAKALNLKEGSEEWYLFIDLAAADRGIIPQDIMDDDKLVSMLPAFFRTLRGQKPTKTEMRNVVEKIRM
jgi:transcriptional regulator with XRE-family HTH domain